MHGLSSLEPGISGRDAGGTEALSATSLSAPLGSEHRTKRSNTFISKSNVFQIFSPLFELIVSSSIGLRSKSLSGEAREREGEEIAKDKMSGISNGRE